MLVYKFYPPEFALQALQKLRFKVSPIDELNDPFEYLSLDMGEKSVRAWAKKFRKMASENTGIISFSKNWHEPLMWAHYAKSHTGMALGFEVPDNMLLKIEYISKKIVAPLDVDEDQQRMAELVEKLLKSKHINWEYEDEARLSKTLENRDEENGLYFADWDHTTMLKEVVLGDRYVTSNNTHIQDFLEESGIRIITARPEFTGFKMTPQKNEKLKKRL